MEITNDQKFKIYTSALHQVEIYQIGICSQLIDYCEKVLGPGHTYNYYFLTTHFQEFTDQRPSNKGEDEYWWNINDRLVRINILKLLIEKYAPNGQGETQNS